jgi:hypothetical protein
VVTTKLPLNLNKKIVFFFLQELCFDFGGIEHIFGDHGLELMGVVFPQQKKQDVNIKCIP